MNTLLQCRVMRGGDDQFIVPRTSAETTRYSSLAPRTLGIAARMSASRPRAVAVRAIQPRVAVLRVLDSARGSGEHPAGAVAKRLWDGIGSLVDAGGL